MLLWAAMLLSMALSASCATPARPTPAGPFPRSYSMPGWRTSGEVQTYTPETLFDYMDGEAEMYFVFGFLEMRMQEYVGEEGGPIRVEVYEVDTVENAYGLFSFYRRGDPARIGNEGDLAQGGLLSFWQDRYVVRVFPVRDVGEEIPRAFAQWVSRELPAGGSPPELVDTLPRERLVPRTVKFFHEKLALDNIIWTVEDNVLSLDADTDALAAAYDYGGARVNLLIVAYPEAEAAGRALRSLTAASSDTLAAAERSDRYVVAVFGAPEQDVATDLVRRTLGLLQSWGE
jgi:hypothetical protein